MAGNVRRLLLGTVLTPSTREQLTQWMVDCKTGNNRLRGGLTRDWKIGDKTGNNGKDACSDIAIAWPKSGGPVLVAVYTQGGSPTPQQFEAVFKDVGAMVGRQLS
jgi:beta-lactamase class A